MMLAISMRSTRVEYPSGDAEIRDSLDRCWWHFLKTALPGRAVAPVPNYAEDTEKFLDSLPITGIVISGGENWGLDPERDATERVMLDYARSRRLPILGVCRGAQALNILSGGVCRPGFEAGHIRTRHHARLCGTPPAGLLAGEKLVVNSYHGSGMMPEDLAPGLQPWALGADGSVEAFAAGVLEAGIMWHPEREKTPAPYDLILFQQFFTGAK